MSRFHQRLRKDLEDPEVAADFYQATAEIALMQALEEARKSFHLTEKELAARMGTQREAITRLFNAEHANPTLSTITSLLSALGLHAEITLRPAFPDEAPIEAKFVPAAPSS
ncbi:MAG TPA: helix-turn-helix transcriptional regulator [Ktedonobacterales bacterium]|jgi:transcriptional regulator with XRE-family HTH domain